MLSKNNYKERLRKMEPKKERFSIRKFTVGAASVLIGFTIFGMNNGQSVKADEVQPSKAVEVNKPETDSTASDHTSEVKGNPNSKSGTDQQGEKQLDLKVPPIQIQLLRSQKMLQIQKIKLKE